MTVFHHWNKADGQKRERRRRVRGERGERERRLLLPTAAMGGWGKIFCEIRSSILLPPGEASSLHLEFAHCPCLKCPFCSLSSLPRPTGNASSLPRVLLSFVIECLPSFSTTTPPVNWRKLIRRKWAWESLLQHNNSGNLDTVWGGGLLLPPLARSIMWNE